MRARGGFTLIEVLVGLAIMVLLVGMVQGIYVSAARNREASLARTAIIHSAASVFSRLTDELSTSFFDGGRPDQTSLYLASESTGKTVLEFTSRVPPVHGLRAGGETRIRYELLEDREADPPGGYLLRRTEVDDIEKDLDREGVSYDLVKGLASFSAECFDGEEWLEKWEDKTRLPQAVRLKLSWGPENGREWLYAAQTVYGR